MSAYRKFSAGVSIAIVERATRANRICCEQCGAWCRKRADYEIDHLLAEGMRPPRDLQRRLTPADGWVLCRSCHAKKTRHDKAQISLAKRRQAYALGLERPGKQKLRARAKAPRPAYKPVVGKPRIAREYGL